MLAISLRSGLVAALALALAPTPALAGSPQKNIAKKGAKKGAKVSDAKPTKQIAKPSAPTPPPPAPPPAPKSSNDAPAAHIYDAHIVAAVTKSVVGAPALDSGAAFRGVGVRKKGLPELVALQDFTLRYESPKQGRPRGLGIEPVLPGIRYDMSSKDADFRYTTASEWQGLDTHATMRHVAAVCQLRSLCKVDVTWGPGVTPVLAGFALRFLEGKEMTKIAIVPDPASHDYAVKVDASGSGNYTVDLYLALVDSDVVVKTATASASRSGSARSADVTQIDQFDPKPGQRRLLQGFSVEMTDGPHPVAELSISGIGDSGPAHVVFQDVAGNRPMNATLWWALVR